MSAPSLPNDLGRLLAFVRVVEAGSFAEAARRAGTTASALSKSIVRFEREHGVRLLHRTTHSLALTEEGDRLMETGRELRESLDRAAASLNEVAGAGGGGRVCVTAAASFARACILPRLPGFFAENPDIQLEIKFRNEILDLAAEGVDIAVRSGRVDGLPGHQAKRMFSYPWIACASPEYLARRGAPQTPHELGAHEHVGFRNPATGQLLGWRFEDPRAKGVIRITPKPRHVVDDADAAIALVQQSLGVAWGPVWLVSDSLRSGRLVEVLGDWRVPEEPLWMVRTSRRQPPQRTLRTMQFLSALHTQWTAPETEAR